jgi:hypothetical protein
VNKQHSRGIIDLMKSVPMAVNGTNNSISIRDERGRYLKGIAGGPAYVEKIGHFCEG